MSGRIRGNSKYYFDEQWSPELNQAWTDAITVIASTMIEGMNATPKTVAAPVSPASEQNINDMVKSFAKDLLRKTIEDQMDDVLMPLAREKVRALLKQALREEMKELFKTFHEGKDQKKVA